MSDTQQRFFADLATAFNDRFGVTISTHWGIFSMRHVTSRDDDEPLTAGQNRFIADFEAAWIKGSTSERKEAGRGRADDLG